jgi:DeoR family transcriptional regulator of aga operon
MKTTSERRESILSTLRKQGSVQGVDLAKQFGVSTVTIRNDLGFLEKQSIATRTYGGAYLNKDIALINEVSLNEKKLLNDDVKEKIGAAAAKLIKSGDTLILDSGTTTQKVAKYIKQYENITVLTNGLNVGNTLSDANGVEVIITGGKLRHKSSSLFGAQAEESLQNYRFDKLFLGVDGFNLTHGVTTHNEYEARLNRCMCNAADEIIVVTDSSKFSKISLHKILDPIKISKIITDTNIPAAYLEGLKAFGIEVILVD